MSTEHKRAVARAFTRGARAHLEDPTDSNDRRKMPHFEPLDDAFDDGWDWMQAALAAELDRRYPAPHERWCVVGPSGEIVGYPSALLAHRAAGARDGCRVVLMREVTDE